MVGTLLNYYINFEQFCKFWDMDNLRVMTFVIFLDFPNISQKILSCFQFEKIATSCRHFVLIWNIWCFVVEVFCKTADYGAFSLSRHIQTKTVTLPCAQKPVCTVFYIAETVAH